MDNQLPKITIITPSYNQAHFIDETILSVLRQNYPNFELIVVDGGSTDGTLDILRKYEGQIFWTSGPDEGQTNAINIGLRRASGDIVAFLNSDDIYAPGAFLAVGQYFADHEECFFLTGRCRSIDENGKEIRQLITLYKNFWALLRNQRFLLVLNYISQPATFWRKSVIDQLGYFDESLHYTMDYEYWLRVSKSFRIHSLPRELACFRVHSRSKSGTTAHRQFDEELMVAKRYAKGFPILLHNLHRLLIVFVYRHFLRLDKNHSVGLNLKNEKTAF